MKKILLAMSAFALALVLAACSQNTDPTPTLPNVAGAWTDPSASLQVCGNRYSSYLTLSLAQQEDGELTGHLDVTDTSENVVYTFSGVVDKFGTVTGEAEAGSDYVPLNINLNLAGGSLGGKFTGQNLTYCGSGYTDTLLVYTDFAR